MAHQFWFGINSPPWARNSKNQENRRTSNMTDDSDSVKMSPPSCAPIASLDGLEDLQISRGESTATDMDASPTSQEPAGGGAGGGLTVPRLSAQLSRQSSSVGSSQNVRYRPLGKSGLRVPSIGLGTWVTLSPQVSDDTAEEVITCAYENGINLFDTAEFYSGDQAELRLGRILKKQGWRRTGFIVITKVYWSNRGEDRGLSRKRIIESLKASLERLQLEYVDIFIIQKMDPKCPMEEVVRACTYCINQGWAMYWGTAKWTPAEIFEAYTNCRQFNCILPIVEQTEYHMFCREKTELYMPETFNKIGVGCMSWSPLSIGLVSGKMEDGLPLFTRPSFKRKYASWDGSDNNKQNNNAKREEMSPWNADRLNAEDGKRTAARLREISLLAEKLGCSVTQLAVAWSLKNDTVGCVLVGAVNCQQVVDHIQALALVSRLTSTVLADMETALENRPRRPPVVSTLEQR
ncbi:voltage-gated potassium channel subunit beta-2-like isoform X2 [Amphibalanus amphitrite]|uniref:voltage-gated potassium channel subunit beta-2-like isoform X2 n=2 Tax=Amphibalanus amphitrite TaxID=1232801 RepID=UPI001C9230F2|nr:voltage-gated potassium channel subunit beta-2-like isoform X2 [Amphibalanus amphitrite]